MSIRTKLQNKDHVTEALCRAKFKFPGRPKIHISKKWEFTKFNADEFENMMAEKRLILDGYGVKYIPNHGPRTNGGPCTHERLGTAATRGLRNSDLSLNLVHGYHNAAWLILCLEKAEYQVVHLGAGVTAGECFQHGRGIGE
eukprot:bmy_17078T0